jgi:glycosyltransferase involved in cell wall biosynthesis
MSPSVSVVIPAYNAEPFLHKALDSVLAQSYGNLEVLVVDDGSRDGTAAVARAYRERDARVILLVQPNGGLSNARNAGIRQARGEYIAYLDADDYWLPDKIAAQTELMQANPHLAFCSTATRVETPEGEFLNVWPCPVADGPLLERLFRENGAIPGSGSGVMVRRSAQTQAGFFDETLKSLEDIDMWMRLAGCGDYACLPECLTVILKRKDSMSRNLEVMRASALQVMRKNRTLLPPEKRGAFWRDGLASVLCDYAKWESRSGRHVRAIFHLLQALALSPVKKFRLCASLIVAILNPWGKF